MFCDVLNDSEPPKSPIAVLPTTEMKISPLQPLKFVTSGIFESFSRYKRIFKHVMSITIIKNITFTIITRTFTSIINRYIINIIEQKMKQQFLE